MSPDERAAWGRFYVELHKIAEGVRAKKTLANASTSASEQTTADRKSQRQSDFTTADSPPQTEAANA